MHLNDGQWFAFIAGIVGNRRLTRRTNNNTYNYTLFNSSNISDESVAILEGVKPFPVGNLSKLGIGETAEEGGYSLADFRVHGTLISTDGLEGITTAELEITDGEETIAAATTELSTGYFVWTGKLNLISNYLKKRRLTAKLTVRPVDDVGYILDIEKYGFNIIYTTVISKADSYYRPELVEDDYNIDNIINNTQIVDTVEINVISKHELMELHNVSTLELQDLCEVEINVISKHELMELHNVSTLELQDLCEIEIIKKEEQ